jgi:transposase
MNKKYIVRLTNEERAILQDVISKGNAAAYKIKHAHLLLKADVNGPNWPDEQIAEAVSTSINTVRNIRQRLVEKGFEAALRRRKRATPPKPKTLDGVQEARLIALRCSAPPAGYAKWTLHLLTAKLIELHVVERISLETVRQTLKKMS